VSTTGGTVNRSTGPVRFGGCFTLPTSEHIEDYRRVVVNLPEVDPPAAFGLAANIARSTERVNSLQIVEQLKVLRRSSEISGGFNRKVWHKELTQSSSTLSQWEQLIQGKDLVGITIPLPSADADPIESFVLLERYNAHALVKTVSEQLAELGQVIKGQALLTPDVYALGSALLRQETPMAWSKVWAGPEDPLKWCRQLLAKTLALASWATEVQSGRLLQSELDLSQLFNPGVFLSALRQQTARSAQVAMDTLVLQSSWTNNFAGDVNCKIKNLMIQGCAFDGKKLRESQRDSTEFAAIPPCFVGWTTTPPTNTIDIPLFGTELREDLITTMTMPLVNGEDDKWIQAAVALFLKPLA